MGSKDILDKIITSEPVNTTAAMVTSGGVHYDSPKKLLLPHFDTQPSLRQITETLKNNGSFEDLSGRSFARFRVIGLSEKQGWVVRCTCGKYEIRSKRAILNPANTLDRCQPCQHLRFRKKERYWLTTGHEMPEDMLK